MKIIGHQKQISYLHQLLQKNKLPHALLFSGPEGIGKKLVAQHFVQRLFCQDPSSPCNTCKHCSRILQNTHPDYILISSQDHLIKTETIRDLKQRLSLKALEAPYKIALIDEAHTLHTSAANVLLKTLEEPPENTFLILVTSSPYSLLKTILSRCQKIEFSPLSISEMQQVVSTLEEVPEKVSITQKEKIAMAQGSPGLFLKFSEEAFDLLHNIILPAVHSQPKDLMKLLEVSEKLSKEEKLAENVLNLLLIQWSKKISSDVSLAFSKKIEAIYEASQKLKKTHINPQLTFENLFLKLCL